MNRYIRQLYDTAGKNERLIIGLMSGTSLDGLDVALCKIKGHGSTTELELLQFETFPFNEEMKTEVRSVFSKQQVDLQKLTLLNPWIALQHAAIINMLLRKWKVNKDSIDLIASHGQTIYHAPKSLHGEDKFSNATLQIGDADHLATATGVICVSDFRQKHIAAGGEGAPLAAYGDLLLFGKEDEDRLLLNIGGIANFTLLPRKGEEAGIMCTDIGPGNTMMDAYVQANFPGKYFDDNAGIARQGKIDESLLEALKDHVFFRSAFPKTTGPELFNLSYLDNAMAKADAAAISTNDVMATLNRFTADCIAEAIKTCCGKLTCLKIFSSGGGAHNPLLMENIRQQLPSAEFHSTAELNIDPDAKEAVLFAVLANECVAGEGIKGAGLIDVSMGKISFPG